MATFKEIHDKRVPRLDDETDAAAHALARLLDRAYRMGKRYQVIQDGFSRDVPDSLEGLQRTLDDLTHMNEIEEEDFLDTYCSDCRKCRFYLAREETQDEAAR